MLNALVALFRVLQAEGRTYEALDSKVASSRDFEAFMENKLSPEENADLQSYMRYLQSSIADLARLIGPMSIEAKGTYIPLLYSHCNLILFHEVLEDCVKYNFFSLFICLF